MATIEETVKAELARNGVRLNSHDVWNLVCERIVNEGHSRDKDELPVVDLVRRIGQYREE